MPGVRPLEAVPSRVVSLRYGMLSACLSKLSVVSQRPDHSMNPSLRAILIGEFLGTMLLVLLGDGVVASVDLLDKQAELDRDHDGLGPGGHARGLRQRAAERRAPQPGGHARPGRAGRGPLAVASRSTGAPSSPGRSSGRCSSMRTTPRPSRRSSGTTRSSAARSTARQARRPGRGRGGGLRDLSGVRRPRRQPLQRVPRHGRPALRRPCA